MTITTEIQALAPTALIELFALDTTNLSGGEVMRFHAGTNALQQPIVWQGQTYNPLPIEAEGFDVTSKGSLPRPRVRVANVSGMLSAAVRESDDLVGCKVIRKRTFARFLDAVNFPQMQIKALDLRFDQGEFDSRITFTRNSTATYFGADGLLKTAAANAPRIDYDPVTHACKGLLIEEQRTNSLRNNTMVGAVAGSPGTMPTDWSSSLVGGMTRQVVGSGTINGVEYVDVRITGTPASTGASVIYFSTASGAGSVPVVQGETWTVSAWTALVGGSLDNVISTGLGFKETTSAGAGLTSGLGAGFTPNATLARQAYTRIIANASCAYYQTTFRWGHRDTVTPVDFTIRIGLPQLEKGSSATSVIKTSVAAATRAADVASMTGANFSSWFNPTEGTFVTDSDFRQGARSLDGAAVFCIDDSSGNSNNIIGALYSTNSSPEKLWLIMQSGGVAQLSGGQFQSASLNEARNSVAYAYKSNDVAAVGNGGAVYTDTSAVLPVAPNALRIGSYYSNTNRWLNGHIARLTYYPVRHNNTMLQSFTAPTYSESGFWATPDPNQYLPDDVWFVEQKLSENRYVIEWELASAFDLQGVRLPYREVIQNACTWKYRSAECSYTGIETFDANDKPCTADKDSCAKRLSSCRVRFGDNPLPFGGFPGSVRYGR